MSTIPQLDKKMEGRKEVRGKVTLPMITVWSVSITNVVRGLNQKALTHQVSLTLSKFPLEWLEHAQCKVMIDNRPSTEWGCAQATPSLWHLPTILLWRFKWNLQCRTFGTIKEIGIGSLTQKTKTDFMVHMKNDQTKPQKPPNKNQTSKKTQPTTEKKKRLKYLIASALWIYGI